MSVKLKSTIIFRNKLHELFKIQTRNLILGIETSCDDCGSAVVSTGGELLGEGLHSQHLVHLNYGGIIPPVAQDLHRKNIEGVVNKALQTANLNILQIDAIAVTVEPGLPLSLQIGMKYGKYLCRKYGKPFIPIHHMKAHALTARMDDKSIQFPFLVLLISGGHCMLNIAHSVDDFSILGQTLDDSPGEAFDKVSRRMKLSYLPQYKGMSGGQCIEAAAKIATNVEQFKFTIPLQQYRDCNFSIAGLKNQVVRHIQGEETKHKLSPDALIPDVYNLAAGFQLAITMHLCYRLQRAIEFVETEGEISHNCRTLVVSGGVACNDFISSALEKVCKQFQYKFVRPRPKLCTDNGVMIAWNGVERWRENLGITTDLESIDVKKDSPIGRSLIERVTSKNISCNWLPFKKMIYS